MSAPRPRPYQDEVHLDAGRAIARQVRAGNENPSILIRLPTGGGKTYVGTRMMHNAERKGNSSIFLAPRRELVYQTQKRLRTFGVEAGIIMAGEAMHQQRLCQIASADTLHHRAMKRGTILLPRSKLVIPDEAHLWAAMSRANILNAFGKGTVTVGLSATPARADGLPLGDLFDELVLGWNERQMMDEGYLVDCQYYAPSKPDLKAMRTNPRTVHGYVEADVEAEMMKPKIVGDIIDNWFRLARGMSTVVFCVTKSHARFVTEQFQRRGVSAACVTDDTKDEDRRAIFEQVEAGIITVLVNVFVASYGLDIPRLRCCVLARPTKSLVMYKQMGGRVLRPIYADWATVDMLEESAEMRLAAIADSEKPYAVMIDHAGAIDRLGYLDEDAPWTLEGTEDILVARDRQRNERQEPKEITCSSCKRVFKGTRYCPYCGHEMIAPGKPVPYHAADLVPKERDGTEANKKTSWEDKAEFMAQAKGYAQSKGYKDGFAANLYRKKFGVWPNDPRVRDAATKPPGELVRNFVKHVAIKRRHSGVPA